MHDINLARFNSCSSYFTLSANGNCEMLVTGKIKPVISEEIFWYPLSSSLPESEKWVQECACTTVPSEPECQLQLLEGSTSS